MTNNFTTGTTFIKWFFSSINNIAIVAISIAFNILLYFTWDGSLALLLTIGGITNLALLITVVGSVITWRKEKNRLN